MNICAEDKSICPTVLTLSSGCSYNINYNHDQSGNVVLEFEVVDKATKSSPFKVTVDETLAEFFQVGKFHTYTGNCGSSTTSKSMAEIYTWSHLLARKPAGTMPCFDEDEETWFSDEENQESVVNPSLQSFHSRVPIKLRLKPTHSRGGSFDSIGIEVEYSDGKPKVMEISKYAWIKKGELEIHFSSSGGLHSQPELEINLGNSIIFPTYSDFTQDDGNQEYMEDDLVQPSNCVESSITPEDYLQINGEILDRDGSGDNGTPMDENEAADDTQTLKTVKEDTGLATESREVQTMITFTPTETSEFELNFQEVQDKSSLYNVYLKDRFVIKGGKNTLSSICSKDEDFVSFEPELKSEAASDSNFSWSTSESHRKNRNKSSTDVSKSVVFISNDFERKYGEEECKSTPSCKVESEPAPERVVPEHKNTGGGEVVERIENIGKDVNEGVLKDSTNKEKEKETEGCAKALECGDLNSTEINVNKYHYVDDIKAYGAMKSLCEVGKQTIEKSNVVMKALLSVEKEISPLKEELYKLKHKVFDLDMPLCGIAQPVQRTLRAQTKSSRIIGGNAVPLYPSNAHYPYYPSYSCSTSGLSCSCHTCAFYSTPKSSTDTNEGNEKLYREAIDSTKELKELVTGMKDIYQRALMTKSESISVSGFPQDLSDLKPRVSVSRKSISSGISWKKELISPHFVSNSIFSEPEDIFGEL